MIDGVQDFMRQWIKSKAPPFILELRDRMRREWIRRQFRGLDTRETFRKIYEEGYWGGVRGEFCSGIGSRESAITEAYISAVSNFIQRLEFRPSVVDVGCGDFVVGARIRNLCGRYHAIDVVDKLIEENTRKYGDMDVTFSVCDASEGPVPEADIIFIRQVLQHLSNSEIQKTINNVDGKYRFLIVTEHLPGDGHFVANREKPTGPDIRVKEGSGVDITKPPFNFKCSSLEVLCRVAGPGNAGVIETTLYVY